MARSSLLIVLTIVTGLAVPLLAAPRDSAVFVQQATDLVARGDTTGAIDLLEHSHLDDHADPRASLLLGRLWRERGSIDARLRSQRVLENARMRFPDDPDVLVELGSTYFAQRFFPDAIGCFQRAVETDGSRCDARYLIGLYYYRNWKRMNQYRDDLKTARHELKKAADCDPTHADAARLYLYARYALADTSAREAEEILKRFPADGSFRLYRGALAYDAAQYDLCARHFEKGLSLLSERERAPYHDLLSVLPVTAHDTYRDVGKDVRDVVRRAYWVDADPDPTTVVNERELEHIYRVFVSDLLFSNDWTGRRGWTCDRGNTFIKFGRPMSIEHTLGGGQDGHVEKWAYLRDGQFSDFLFVDEFLNGDPRIPYGDDFTLHFMLHAAESSEIASSTARIPALLDVSIFRDDDLNASLYVGMRVDADSVENYALPGSTNRYLIRGAYFDHAWKREAADGDTLWTSELPARAASGVRVIEFVRRMALPFDGYRVAWSLEDEHKRVRALARGDADARRFADDGLTLSDVLLFEEQPEDAAKAVGVIERGGLRMRPRIGHVFTAGDPLRAYTEVYGLHALAGTSEFEVRYTIYPGQQTDSPVWKDWIRGAADVLGFGEEEPVIAQSFTRTVQGHTTSEYITIDINALKPGAYDLVVQVMDLNSGAQATRHTSLTVETGPVAKRRN